MLKTNGELCPYTAKAGQKSLCESFGSLFYMAPKAQFNSMSFLAPWPSLLLSREQKLPLQSPRSQSPMTGKFATGPSSGIGAASGT
jgi:hypothetical protein